MEDLLAMDFGGLDFNVAALIFILMVFVDGIHVAYTRYVMDKRPMAAAGSSAAIYLISGFTVIQYTANPIYVAIVALGSFVGTFLVVRLAPDPAASSESPSERRPQRDEQTVVGMANTPLHSDNPRVRIPDIHRSRDVARSRLRRANPGRPFRHRTARPTAR